MSDLYGLPEDLRRLITSSRNTTHLPVEPPCLYGGAASATFPPPNYTYDPMIVGDIFYPRSSFTHHHYDYSSTVNPTNTTIAAAAAAAASNSDHATASTAFCVGLETSDKGWLGNFDSCNNRWPRQETLSLLEIRSRLDSKFRENNQKAPLWNEISRIMAEEFGYQRSGKKCKEKFENLYKYYKKTKEGKASRQDGKHYRFFRQLEAICGEPNTNSNASTLDKITPNASFVATQTPTFTINQENTNGNDHNLIHNHKYSQSLSFSNSSEFETSSSENNDEDLSTIAHTMKSSKEKGQSGHRRARKSWRGKVEEIVDSHMKNIIETQDAWMERMLSVVEQREQEMASKEEERKRKESMRFDQEIHELWAKEKAWVEARDSALLEVVRKHIGIQLEAPNKSKSQEANDTTNYEYPFESVDNIHRWTEMEISNLIQLRSGFEHQVREKGYLDDGVWDEIGERMVYMGFNRNGAECKKIWDDISMSLRRTVDCGVKNTRPWCLGLKLTDDDDL